MNIPVKRAMAPLAWAAIALMSGAVWAQSGGSAAPKGSEGSKAAIEDVPGWVATAAVGHAQGPADWPVSVTLGGPVAITLPGQARFDRGNGGILTVARQFEGLRFDEGRRHLPLRLEVEGLRAWLPRKGITLGVASAALADSMSVQGAFVNGLVRVRRDDSVRWWLGAGIGRLQTDLPDASSALPGCGCLKAGQAEGTVWRAKARVELIGSADWAMVLDAGYTRLPALQGGSKPGTVTDYPSVGLRTVMLGWRLSF